MQGRVSLLLDGLEVVNKYTENFLDHGLAGRATPSHLPKRTPQMGMSRLPLGRDGRPSIDSGGDLGDGKVRHAAA